MMARFQKLLLLMALVAILPLALVRAASQTIILAPGDHLDVTCSTSLTGTMQNQSAGLDCAPLPATPTNTPVPPTATPITPLDPMVGICGESTHSWHAPVVNGCQTGHEHGDAPTDLGANVGLAAHVPRAFQHQRCREHREACSDERLPGAV
jgi:hypothetical protein